MRSITTAAITLLGTTGLFGASLSPFIDLQQQGLSLSVDGTGLASGFSSTSLTVSSNGPTSFALLYWNGFQTGCTGCLTTQPYGDQQVQFGGNPFTGTVIGSEQNGTTEYVGYYADVTGIVSAAGTGTHSFSFGDGNAARNLSTVNGVELILAYQDPTDLNTYRVLVQDGLDFTTTGNPSTAVTFNHGSAAFDRTAALYTIAGGGTAAGTDQTTISNNPTLFNVLAGTSGSAWDSLITGFNIPAGVGTTTVQVSGITDPISWQVEAIRLNPNGSVLVSSVPEPSTIVLSTLAAVFAYKRRRAGRA